MSISAQDEPPSPGRRVPAVGRMPLQQSHDPPDGHVAGEPAASITEARGADLAAQDRRRHAERRARGYLLRAAHWMGRWVHHPDGGDRTVEEIVRDAEEQRAQIEADRRNGSRMHNRLPRWMARIPRIVFGFDFCLLLYFFTGISDVNWASPLSWAMAFAVLLAAAVTVLAYGLFWFSGHRMRSYKDHAGAVHLSTMDAFTKAALGGSAMGIVVLAMLMFVRMRTEVMYALGPDAGTADLVALTLAVVSGLANFLTISVHAHDGSDQVDRLNRLSASSRRALARAHRMRVKAAMHADVPVSTPPPPAAR